MLKKYKHALLDEINSRGINPSRFVTEHKDLSFSLEVESSGILFVLGQSSTSHEFDYVYTANTHNRCESKGLGWFSLGYVVGQFSEWLENEAMPYLEDVDTPDLWAMVESGQDLVSKNPDPIAKPETEHVAQALVHFETEVRNSEALASGQLAEIHEQVVYLTEAVERLNKRDWVGVAISTVLGLVTNLGVDKETGKWLWDLFMSCVSPVMKLLK